MQHTEEKVVNGWLAEALMSRNPAWRRTMTVEAKGVLEDSLKQPDILVQIIGNTPVVVETEFSPKDAVQDAKKRLEEAVKETGDRIETAIAVQLPEILATIPAGEGPQACRNTTYGVTVLRRTGREITRWPPEGRWETTIDGLARTIDVGSVSAEKAEQCAEVMQRKVGQAAAQLGGTGAAVDTKMGEALHQEPGEQTRRMASAMVLNAILFHGAVAVHHSSVRSLGAMRTGGQLNKTKLETQWEYILQKINYWPIFAIARRCLLAMPEETGRKVLERLGEAEEELAGIGLTTSHHLAGQMFQRLIADRHFLKTYYTRPPSARLLGEMVLDRKAEEVPEGHWEKSTVGDLACGTGTLLAATYDRIRWEMRTVGREPDKLHGAMMEECLTGMDIMPAATHMAVSQLASAAPGQTFKRTRVWRMKYGEDERGEIHIGALGLMDAEYQEALDTGDEEARRTGERAHGEEGMEDMTESAGRTDARHKSFDVLVMNPPFTRSTCHEAESAGVPRPAFAAFGTTEEEQQQMARRLGALYRNAKHVKDWGKPAGHGNVGLASYFIDLATQKLKLGGELGMVLPFTMLQGHDWMNAREHLDRWYRNKVVVSIAQHRRKDRSWSADTHMAEVLLLARRNERGRAEGEDTLFVNVWRRPEDAVEALAVAEAVKEAEHKQGRHDKLQARNGVALGIWMRHPLADGGCPAAVADEAVAEFCDCLVKGKLKLPREARATELAMTTMGKIGRRGLYHLDLTGRWPRGPWKWDTPSETATYPVLKAHDATRETNLVVVPDAQGRPKQDKGAKEKAAQQWKEQAGRFCMNLDFQTNAQPLAACLTQRKVLGGRAWPNFNPHNQDDEVVLACWWNSIFGLTTFWWHGSRQQEGRACLGIDSIPGLPVLDCRQLTPTQKAEFRQLVEEVDEGIQEGRQKPLQPAYMTATDDTRRHIDRGVSRILGIDESRMESLLLLAKKWGAEPTVCGNKGLTKKTK